MKDNIIFRKIWEDDEIAKLNVVCSSSVATITSEIYVSDALIDELICQIKQFLDDNDKEGLWANEGRGDDSVACLSLRFFRKDKLGHVRIEVFMEIDDGGTLDTHNCCFYVNTEIGLLHQFKENLLKLKQPQIGIQVSLDGGQEQHRGRFA